MISTTAANRRRKFLVEKFHQQETQAIKSFEASDWAKTYPIAAARMVDAVYNDHTVLNLKQLGLTCLPKDEAIWQILSGCITVLSLSDNRLSHLPENLALVDSLTLLSVENNCLEMLPNSIAWLPELTHLNLSNNHLQTIFAADESWPQLRSLNLTNNRFTALPGQFLLPRFAGSTICWGKNPDMAELVEKGAGIASLQTLCADTISTYHQNFAPILTEIEQEIVNRQPLRIELRKDRRFKPTCAPVFIPRQPFTPTLSLSLST